MSAVVTTFWNPGPLLASIRARYVTSVAKAGGLAASLAGPLAKSVRVAPGSISSSHPATLMREFGTGAHDIAPKKAKALKFPDGGFASTAVPHPGTGARPFLRPAMNAWPRLFGAGGSFGVGL